MKITVIIFFLSLAILWCFHLMYGNCQASKLHYMVQCYYVPENLPIFFRVKNFCETPEDYIKELLPYEHYTGCWKKWFSDGSYSEMNYKDGVPHGIYILRDSNRDILCLGSYYEGKLNGNYVYVDSPFGFLEKKHYVNGKRHGKETSWHKGKKIYEATYENGKLIEGSEWYSEVE